MQPKKTLYQVDNFRMIAALLVVAIHVSPLQKISMEADFFFTRVVARVGVPFFFMVSGYFLLVIDDNLESKFNAAISSFSHLN